MLVSVRLLFFLLVPISTTQSLALILSASIRLTSPYHPNNLLSWFIADDVTAIAAHKVYPSLYLLYNTNYTSFCTTLNIQKSTV